MPHLAIAGPAKANLLSAKISTLSQWFLFLFDNNVDPRDTFTVADLSIAANAKITNGGPFGAISRPTWGPAFVREDGRGQMRSSNMSVEKKGIGNPLLLYGWLFVDEGGNLKMAQRFDGIVPKVIDRPFFTFEFRIDLYEDSFP